MGGEERKKRERASVGLLWYYDILKAGVWLEVRKRGRNPKDRTRVCSWGVTGTAEGGY